MHPKQVNCTYCDHCGAPIGTWKPRLAGKSQSRCPTCGAPKSQWRKAVKVDKRLPKVLQSGGLGQDTKCQRVDPTDTQALKAAREAALQRAIDTANGDRWLKVWERRMDERRSRYSHPSPLAKHPELMRPPTPEAQTDRKKAPSVADQQRADEAWQNAYEARKQAEMRLGLRGETANNDNDDEFTREWGAGQLRRAAKARKVEDQRDPRAELISAARAGDRAAIRRCDELYIGWRKEERRTANG